MYENIYKKILEKIMKIRADTNNPEKVPSVGKIFKVVRVEKVAAFWTIELEEICQ